MVPVDEPAQAASAKLTAIAAIALDEVVGKVFNPFRTPQIINNRRKVANR
jgi:hypothetical protein